MKYTTDKLETIAAKLRTMPPVEKKKQEHSKQEAIKVLSKEIGAMQKRGYTLDQIAEALRSEGLLIATPTLKSYLQRAKPTKKGATQVVTATTSQAETPRAPVRKEKADASKASFTPKADSDDI